MTSAAPAAERGWAAAALVFNAFSFGLSWWPFRHVAALGVHPLWLTGFSYSAVVIALLLVRPAALLELLRSPALWALLVAAGATNACFNWAVSIGDVVRVVLLFYLMPLWTVLLARLLLGERISTRGAVRVALALAGAVVVLWPAAGGPADLRAGLQRDGQVGLHLPDLHLPDLLALLGGMGFALNNVLLRRAAASSRAASALAMFAGGALVALLLAGLLSQAGTVAWPAAPAPGWVLVAAALAGWLLLANLALQYGAARLPANTVSVILITEVAFASGSAVWLGAGSLGPQVLLGGVLIGAAALLAALQRD